MIPMSDIANNFLGLAIIVGFFFLIYHGMKGGKYSDNIKDLIRKIKGE